MNSVIGWLALLLLIALVFIPTSVRAEEDDDLSDFVIEEDDFEFDIDEEQVDESWTETAETAEVDAAFIFPEYPENNIPIGKIHTALISFGNRGPDALNITAVGGHLHSVYDFSYYIQNFTVQEIGNMVDGFSEISFEYYLRVELPEPIDVWFSGWVDYEDAEGRSFRATFFNNTIELVDAGLEVEATQIVSVVFGFVVIAVIGFMVSAPDSAMDTISGAVAPTAKATKKTAAAGDDGWDVPVYKQKSSGRKKKGSRRR